MKIYLMGYFDDCKWPSEVLNELELIPENKLVETVKTMIDEERICPDLFDEDEDGEYDVENMDVVMAIKILKDDGYTVEEYDL